MDIKELKHSINKNSEQGFRENDSLSVEKELLELQSKKITRLTETCETAYSKLKEIRDTEGSLRNEIDNLRKTIGSLNKENAELQPYKSLVTRRLGHTL